MWWITPWRLNRYTLEEDGTFLDIWEPDNGVSPAEWFDLRADASGPGLCLMWSPRRPHPDSVRIGDSEDVITPVAARYIEKTFLYDVRPGRRVREVLADLMTDGGSDSDPEMFNRVRTKNQTQERRSPVRFVKLRSHRTGDPRPEAEVNEERRQKREQEATIRGATRGL